MKYIVQFALVLLISFFTAIFGDDENAERIINAVSKIHSSDMKKIHIKQLDGGLTNVNYKVTFESATYFVRCGTSQNQLLDLNLENEWFCSSMASEAKLAPKIIYF